MLKEVGCGSSTPPPGDGAISNRQIGTGENNNTDGGLGCGGCGREIAERWYLKAADRAWHCGCLRCCHCRVPLAAELTCFARDGNIYCKEDYYRLVEVVVRGLRSGDAEGNLRTWSSPRNCASYPILGNFICGLYHSVVSSIAQAGSFMTGVFISLVDKVACICIECIEFEIF